MCKLRHLVMLAVVVACGIGTTFSVDRSYRPIARIGPSQEPTKFAGSSQESIVPAEPLDDVRKAERSRRAVRPAGDPRAGGRPELRESVEGMEGRHVAAQTRRADAADLLPFDRIRPEKHQGDAGPYAVHYHTVQLFENRSGFGYWRMEIFKNDRGAESRRRPLTASNWSAC